MLNTDEIRYPNLPLAVYREIAAHLNQIEGVTTELLPQDTQHFDYSHSQVGWLRIQHPKALGKEDRDRLQQILNYYGDRFGAWQHRFEPVSVQPPIPPS
jgi:hypothetical protein